MVVEARPSPPPTPSPTEDKRAKVLPVLVGEGGVEEEVGRGVDGHEEVEETADPAVECVLPLAPRRVEGGEDEEGRRRQLANQEHNHNGDQCDRDSVLLAHCLGRGRNEYSLVQY